MKTAELTGAALDWAVAKCEELSDRDNAATWLRDYLIGFSTKYSTNWSQGGPIIEREGIWLTHNNAAKIHGAHKGDDVWFHKGTTPLEAAMRCYVASKLGDTVDIPKELHP